MTMAVALRCSYGPHTKLEIRRQKYKKLLIILVFLYWTPNSVCIKIKIYYELKQQCGFNLFTTPRYNSNPFFFPKKSNEGKNANLQ